MDDKDKTTKPDPAGRESKRPTDGPPTLADDSKTLADDLQSSVDHRSPLPVPDHDLLACIGRGSYGEVWLARNVMGTYRAVKIVHRAAFEHARPFEREFNGIQKFEPISRSHDGFVDVLQMGRTPECFYYVMELADDVVTGQQIDPATYQPKTLRSQVQGHNALPFEQCIELGLSLTAALGHLHRHGLIHRDIKPSNIIVVNGIAKLADIGLVAEQSEAKSFVGTEGFIPPEGPGTPQADVYSLGKVLYEIATGKDRHEFPALPTLLGDTESDTDTHLLELNSVFLKACQSDLKLRYQSAEEMREDLLLLRSGKSVKRSQTIERRLRLLSRVSVVGVAVTLLILGAYLYAHRRAQLEADLRRSAEQERVRADAQTKVAQQSADESRQRLVQLNVANAVRLMNAGDYFTALAWAVEALRLEGNNAAHDQVHRARIGGLLAASPSLMHVLQDDGPVQHLVYTPDGKRLVTGVGSLGVFGERVGGGVARIWDAQTGSAIGAPMPVPDGVTEMVVSQDGMRLVTGGWNGEVRVWDAFTGEPVSPVMRHSNSVLRVALTRDGRWIASGSRDHTARVWDAHSGEPVTPPLQHTDFVQALAISPDGRLLVTASAGVELYFWELPSGQKRSVSVEQVGSAQSIAFSQDGRWLAFGALGGEVRVIDTRTGQPRRSPIQKGGANHIAFSPDDSYLLSASWKNAAHLWNAQTGQAATPPLQHDLQVTALAFSPDGLRVLTAGNEQSARVWDALTGAPLSPPLKHGSVSRAVAFSPEGTGFAIATDAGTISIWEMVGGHAPLPLMHGAPVTTVLFGSNGKQVLTADDSFTLQLWDAETGTPHGQSMRHGRAIAHASFSPDGRKILTASYDRTARLWNAQTGEPLLAPLVHDDVVSWARVSPDGRRIATASYDRTARVWDAQTGQALTPPLAHPRELNQVEFSSTGEWIVTACRDECAYVWNVATARQIKRLQGLEGWVFTARFGLDDNTILAANRKAIHVWALGSGQAVCAPIRYGPWFSEVAFSPEAKRIFAQSADGDGRIWDGITGQPLTPPLELKVPVTASAFSADSRLIATVANDQGLRVWDSTTAEPILPVIKAAGGYSQVAFHPTSKALAFGAGNLAIIQRWADETRPIEELTGLARLLSGSRFDQDGRLVDLSHEELTQSWQTLQTKPAARAPASALQGWHRYEFARALQARHWFSASFHLDRLSKLGLPPGDLEWHGVKLSSARATPEPPNDLERWAKEVQGRIPPRYEHTKTASIDLSGYYNGTLSEQINGGTWSDLNTLSDLPRRPHKLVGIEFDVRGMICISGSQLHAFSGGRQPTSVRGIRIGQKARRLHFLQGTGWNEKDGVVIGKYIVRYSGGETCEIPIRYGYDVRNYWLKENEVNKPLGAVVAWVGSNLVSTRLGLRYRLYKQQWENPEPETEIEALDFISTMSNCAPALIALTVE